MWTIPDGKYYRQGRGLYEPYRQVNFIEANISVSRIGDQLFKGQLHRLRI